MSRKSSRKLPKVSLRRMSGEPDGAMALMWRNDPRVYKWCRQFDVIHYGVHLNWYNNQKEDPTLSMYMIMDNTDDTRVGVCGLTSIDRVNSRAEFSLYIDPEKQGMGLGEAALRALATKAFNNHNLNCVWGEAFEGNPAIAMFKRVGFKEEGRRRQFYFRDGKYIDAILFSLLRSEI